MIRALLRRLLVLTLAMVAGCSHYEPLSVNGAGTMRVEVDVYKGPLTVSVPGQFGQLSSVLTDFVRVTSEWQQGTTQLRLALGCGGVAPPVPYDQSELRARQCGFLQSAIASSNDMIGAGCYVLLNPLTRHVIGRATYLPVGTCESHAKEWLHVNDYVQELLTVSAACAVRLDMPGKDALLSKLDKTTSEALRSLGTSSDATEIKNQLGDLAPIACDRHMVIYALDNLSALARAAAFRSAASNLRFVPPNRELRAALASFSFIASEYGNQLQSRVAVLSKQLEGRDPRSLPTSDYLRDASNTGFVHLFDYLDATSPGGRETLSSTDRVRMIDQLTADYYWQKVNEVYASGQGEVSMAFIKDDLGNWDLRSFSNDPTELLASYRKATDAVLKTAVNLAKKATPAGQGIGAAEKLLGVAGQLATGEAPAGAAGVPADVAALHARASAQLSARKADFLAKRVRLDAELAGQGGKSAELRQAKAAAETAKLNAEAGGDPTAIAEARLRLEAATNALAEGEAAQKATEARRGALAADALDAAQAVMKDHLSVVVALQQSAVPVRAATSRPADPTAAARAAAATVPMP